MVLEIYPPTRKATVFQTVDAVGHSLRRRTMNAERVPFEVLKERSRAGSGGFRPMKHVEGPRALACGAPHLFFGLQVLNRLKDGAS